jgi:predicted amidohydrolase YtcJ
MHILQFGASLLKISLDRCQNMDQIRETIRAGAQQRPSAARILVSGWMQSTTNFKALASDLDDLDPRPIFIDSKDLHSVWCNSAALKELGVKGMPQPAGGTIHLDSNGVPSGLLDEAAVLNLVWPHLAKVTGDEENLANIRVAVKTYNESGYTGVIELATDEKIWTLMKQVKDEDNIPLRFAAHWLIKPSATAEENLAQVDRAIALHKEYNLTTSPDFRIAGIKVICDGVVDACTAALREPYSSTNTNCATIWSAEHLKPVVEKADRAGLQCALHAIGDAAVKLAVDTLEECGTPGARHRIEHLELTRPEDAKRLGQLGITASIQPVHSDPAILAAWSSLLGDRCSRAFAYREFLDGGAKLAIGTDSPTAPHLPLRNLYTGTTRKSAQNEKADLKPINEHFKLPIQEAFAAASAGSAYACFAEKRVGTLEIGKIADFVVLDMSWNPDELLKAEVKETWFAGRRVFPAGN